MNHINYIWAVILANALSWCNNPISLEQWRINYANDIRLSVEAILAKNMKDWFISIQWCPGWFYKKITDNQWTKIEQVRHYNRMTFKYPERYYLEKSNYTPAPIFAEPTDELYWTSHIVDITQSIGAETHNTPLTIFGVDGKSRHLPCNMPMNPAENSIKAQASLNL